MKIKSNIRMLLLCITLVVGFASIASAELYTWGVTSNETTIYGELGQSVWIDLENTNILGVYAKASASPYLGSYDWKYTWLAPYQEDTLSWSIFAEEPILWRMDIGAENADAWTLRYDIYSNNVY